MVLVLLASVASATETFIDGSSAPGVLDLTPPDAAFVIDLDDSTLDPAAFVVHTVEVDVGLDELLDELLDPSEQWGQVRIASVDQARRSTRSKSKVSEFTTKGYFETFDVRKF